MIKTLRRKKKCKESFTKETLYIYTTIKRDADVLVLLDSDGQHDPDEIPVLIKPVMEDGYDLVAGSRKLKGSKRKGKRPFIRPLGQFVLKIGLGMITGKRHSDPERGIQVAFETCNGSNEI